MQVFVAAQKFLYYGQVERGYSQETQAKHRDCLNTWILPCIGEREIDDIERADILRIRELMQERGLSIARGYSVLMTLKIFLRFCRSVLRLHCLDASHISLPRLPAAQVVFLTNQEVQRVLDGPNTGTMAGLRLRTFMEIALATGMRLSEVLALDRAPFEQGTRELDIVGKGSKIRTVFFSDRCLGWIRHYLSRRVDTCPALFVTVGDFPKRWSKVDVAPYFARLKKEIGLDKKLTPHILRHTFCTNLLNNGADITFIKELAGHQNIDTTARYYLGVDKPALRRVLSECLNYENGAAEHPPARPLTDSADALR